MKVLLFQATEILILFVTTAQPHPPCRMSHLQTAKTSNIESVKMQNYLYSAHSTKLAALHQVESSHLLFWNKFHKWTNLHSLL